MISILFQLALLLLTAWGWGFWVWKICRGARLQGWRCYDWFFFGLAGFMACVLFLHALIYLDLPLKLTSWVGLFVAVAGAVVSTRSFLMHPRVVHRYRRREIVAAGAVFALIFVCQGMDLFHAGPENYYGNAHTDQANYVLLAEFLVEKPFSTTLHDVGFQPWEAKAIVLKIYRLGQSIPHGYLGVVSLTDAKRAYGTLSIFMLSVGALSVFVLARLLSVPRWLAALSGAWWGLLPAITKLHLDGFFSQSCVLFVFPAMAALFYLRRGRLEQTQVLLLTLYLGYLLCTYTEVYVIGVGLLGSLVVLAARPATTFRLRAAALAIMVAGSLLLSGGYLKYFVHYIVMQYQTAANPIVLADLVPMSGTWQGWKQIFFGFNAMPDPRLERLSFLVGFGLVFLAGCAFQGRSLAKRRFLLALIAPPVGLLALLLSAPELSKYPFAKLLDTFTTIWLVLAMVGLLHLLRLLALPRWLGRALPLGIGAAFTLVAAYGSWPQWHSVYTDGGILAAVDAPGARRSYIEAETHPHADYIIREPHNIVCAWLAYAARHSKVYVDADLISDLPLPIASYAFRRLPQVSYNLVVLNGNGFLRVGEYQGPPSVVIRNPQGIDGDGLSTWYWIGPDATIEVIDYKTRADSANRYLLKFNASAGPADPSPERGIVLVSPDGSEQKIDFVTAIASGFKIDVRPGKNSYTLRVAYPTEDIRKIPTDPRNHMVRVENFSLTDLRLLQSAETDNKPAAAP